MESKNVVKLILRLLKRFDEKQKNQFKLTKSDQLAMNTFLHSFSLIISGKLFLPLFKYIYELKQLKKIIRK